MKKQLLLFVVCVFCVTNTVSALSTVYVNNTYTSTSTEGKVLGVDVFRTIQEAVKAVDDGGTVYVSTGLYNEPVLITKSVSIIGGLQEVKVGANPNAPVVNGGSAVSTITIDGITKPIDVTIRNLIISKGKYGISALYNAKVEISHNTINRYAKNGITFGSVLLPGGGNKISGTISNNEVIGLGPTKTLAQNGIQISKGNTAIITGNKIHDNTFSIPGTKWATGILIHESDGVTISNNTLFSNQLGINLIQSDATTVANNTINGTIFSKAGIMVKNYDTDTPRQVIGNTIKHNTLVGGLVGIWSSYADGNKYLNNNISKNVHNGIYLWNSNNNTLSGNTVSAVHRRADFGGIGIELDDDSTTNNKSTSTSGSQNNTITNNTITESDTSFLLSKNSKNNKFNNNRFNGSVVAPEKRVK